MYYPTDVPSESVVVVEKEGVDEVRGGGVMERYTYRNT